MDGQAGMAGDWVSLAVKTALSRERKETATYSVGTTLRTLHMQNANRQTDKTITGQKNRGGKRDEELK